MANEPTGTTYGPYPGLPYGVEPQDDTNIEPFPVLTGSIKLAPINPIRTANFIIYRGDTARLVAGGRVCRAEGKARPRPDHRHYPESGYQVHQEGTGHKVGRIYRKAALRQGVSYQVVRHPPPSIVSIGTSGLPG